MGDPTVGDAAARHVCLALHLPWERCLCGNVQIFGCSVGASTTMMLSTLELY